MINALGLLEVDGMVAAIDAADAMQAPLTCRRCRVSYNTRH